MAVGGGKISSGVKLAKFYDSYRMSFTFILECSNIELSENWVRDKCMYDVLN